MYIFHANTHEMHWLTDWPQTRRPEEEKVVETGDTTRSNWSNTFSLEKKKKFLWLLFDQKLNGKVFPSTFTQSGFSKKSRQADGKETLSRLILRKCIFFRMFCFFKYKLRRESRENLHILREWQRMSKGISTSFSHSSCLFPFAIRLPTADFIIVGLDRRKRRVGWSRFYRSTLDWYCFSIA